MFYSWDNRKKKGKGCDWNVMGLKEFVWSMIKWNESMLVKCYIIICI